MPSNLSNRLGDMSSTSGHSADADRAERHHRSMWRLSFGIGLFTALGAVVTLLVWLGVNPSGSGIAAAPSATDSRENNTSKGAGPAAVTDPLTNLTLQAGGNHIVELPKPIRDDTALAGALVIGCPTNQSNDKTRDVTYLLRGQYQELTAAVRAHFTHDPRLRATLTAIGVYKERDGTLRYSELAAYLATGDLQPVEMLADVEKAEQLTLRVRCDEPGGVLIVTGGSLSRT